MPKISGLFDYFPKASSLPIEKLAGWLKKHDTLMVLENNFQNRLLYAQAVPRTLSEAEFDLVILREALRLSPEDFYQARFKRICIPEEFLTSFPDLPSLVMAFTDVFAFRGLTGIFLKSKRIGLKSLGTVLKTTISPNSHSLIVRVDNKKYEVGADNLVVIPAKNNRVDLKVEGEKSLVAEVMGGDFGVAIDTR